MKSWHWARALVRMRLAAAIRVAAAVVLIVGAGASLSYLRASEVPVTRRTLLSAASSLNTAVTVVPNTMAQCRESAIYVEWGTGVSAGAVKVESAYLDTYAGTWAPLQTVTYVSGSPKTDIVQITGVHGALQTRVSTAVMGGTVTTRLVCN